MKNIIKTHMIENYRRKKGLSKKSMCQLCKMSIYTYNKIISNKTNFRLLAIFRIAKVMQVDVAKLLSDR